MDSKAKKKALEDEKRLQTYVLAWKNVKPGSKYNRPVRTGVLLKRKKKSEKYEPHWCALYSNVLVWYDSKKEPPLETAPEEWIRLEMVNADAIQKCPGSETDFEVPTKEETYRFRAESREDQHEWWYGLQRVARLVGEAHRELMSIPNPMEQLEKVFPYPGFTAPALVISSSDSIMKWMEKIQSLTAEQKKWNSYLLKMRMFADLVYTHGAIVDWFYGEGIGHTSVAKKIEMAQREALATLSRAIAPIEDEVRRAFAQCIFQEDVAEVIKKSRHALSLIECYNTLKKDILGEPGDYDFLDTAALVQTYLALFQKLPFAEQIVLDTKIYSGGAVVVNDNRWIYRPLPDNPKEAILECLTVPTLPAFQIKGSVSVCQTHGALIWNKVYWVWMHPRVRFTLRYNWSVRKQIFRFYAYEAAWQPGQRYLPDYKWTGTTLEPVANNRKEPMERFFPCEVHGPVPLHIAMLVALMNEILVIMREQLGVISEGDPNALYKPN